MNDGVVVAKVVGGSRRSSRWAALLLVLAGCSTPLVPPTPLVALIPYMRLIGVTTLPTGAEYAGTQIGGLSGIDYSAERDEYLLISDDPGRDGPARIYTARLRYSARGVEPPQFTGVQAPRHASGQPFVPAGWAPWRLQPGMDRPDAEAVRWWPGSSDRYLWASEGDFQRDLAAQLRLQRLDGGWLRDLPLPAQFAPQDDERGPRANGTLEGLALTPDGTQAWLSLELPLQQDGEAATPADAGAPVRITAIDLVSGKALRQLAYPVDRVPHRRRLPGPQSMA